MVHPINLHSQFLPLRTHFQEGGTGGLIFSRPQDWPSVIHENTSAQPHRIRRWGPQPVHLDDLHIHLLIGQIIYGGNQPPSQHDPVDPQCPQKAIEAAFFQGTVGIVLEPGTFCMTYDRLTVNQQVLYMQSFPAVVEDPNQLAHRGIVEYLARSGVTESWFQHDIIMGYTRSYLRDWARHQTRLTPAANKGRLLFILYPGDISHLEDCYFIEDAMRGEKPWENNQPETPQDERTEVHNVELMEMPMDEPTETPTDEAPWRRMRYCH